MLTLLGKPQRYCDQVSRRQFLQAGGLGLGGLTLADLMRAEHGAQAADGPIPPAAGQAGKSAKSVIYVVLGGGPSHIDMWDLKPNAPQEYRGPFRPIATSLPGEHICEHMPLLAGTLNQWALIRGIRSVENDHYLSEVYTGLPRASGSRPAFGSVVSRLAPTHDGLPSYVSLDRPTTDQFEFEKPHYVGAGHAPFRPFEEALDDLAPFANRQILQDRSQLLAAFDRLHRQMDRQEWFGGFDRFQQQALQLVASSQVRDAFDLTQESEETLLRYGHKAGQYPHQTVKSILYDWDAKPFVLARRLVEAGIRVVTLRVGSWDHHSGPESDVFFALERLMKVLDKSMTALAEDLHQRGLADDVLVVVLGEFGRTPKISYPGPGREHWADAGCALFFGGGLKMGQVIGATDSRAERSCDGTITFQNVMATLYHVLGVDPTIKLPDFSGRPQYLLDDPAPVAALV